jgi:hypothetical protein
MCAVHLLVNSPENEIKNPTLMSLPATRCLLFSLLVCVCVCLCVCVCVCVCLPSILRGFARRGQALHGELAYGPNGRKSAANPDKVLSMDGIYTEQVMPGFCHSMADACLSHPGLV